MNTEQFEQDFLATLAAIVGDSHVLTDELSTTSYYEDWSGHFHGVGLSVVLPRTVEEVSAVVSACSVAKVSVVPQGGNTGLCGGATPRGREVVLSLTRLNRIRLIDNENATITVEAGCTLQSVQDRAAEVGKIFPLSLAAEGSATIGGNLSTNAGGVQVLRYGNIRDLTLGLEVVLPDGRIWDGLRGLRKDNTGYDLKQLFIGSEGTLGVITAAVLKLHPQPRQVLTAWVAVPDPKSAVLLLGVLQASLGNRITAFELVSEFALELVLRHIPNCCNPLPDNMGWALLIEVSDTMVEFPLGTAFESALMEAMNVGLVANAAIAGGVRQAESFWRLRESISEAQKREGLSIRHDISVPISLIPDFINEAEKRLMNDYGGMRPLCFGHVGDGNIHYNILAKSGSTEAEHAYNKCSVSKLIYDVAVEFRGSISAEHGLGQLKNNAMARYKPALDVELMQAIKNSIDPHNLMNPGKVLPC